MNAHLSSNGRDGTRTRMSMMLDNDDQDPKARKNRRCKPACHALRLSRGFFCGDRSRTAVVRETVNEMRRDV
jgi:hypothetical protein